MNDSPNNSKVNSIPSESFNASIDILVDEDFAPLKDTDPVVFNGLSFDINFSRTLPKEILDGNRQANIDQSRQFLIHLDAMKQHGFLRPGMQTGKVMLADD